MDDQEKTEDVQSLGVWSLFSPTRVSQRSSRSSASIAAARACAKAEAARIELSYAGKEANVMKEKARLTADTAYKEADLQAQLHVLKLERAAAAASAEARVLEAAVEEEIQSRRENDIPVPSLNPAQRTRDYVQKHSMSNASENRLETGRLDSEQEWNTRPLAPYAADEAPRSVNLQQLEEMSFQPLPTSQTFRAHMPQPKVDVGLRPMPTLKKYDEPPQMYAQTAPTSETAAVPDMVKFLIRREVVTSGSQKFDDRPQNYWGWKSSFISLTKDLALSPREELDLLVKWLGPQSSE